MPATRNLAACQTTTASPLQRSETVSTETPSANWTARLDAKLDAMRTSIVAQLSACMRETEERVMSRLGELTAELGNLKRAVKGVEERVDKVELQCAPVTQLCNDVKLLRSQQLTVKNIVDRVAKAEVGCAQVAQLRTDVSALRAQLDDYENIIASHDVIVRGVPAVEGENVREVLAKICNAVQLSTLPVRAAFRLPRGNSNATAPLIFKLNTADDRSLLFRAAASFRKTHQRSIMLRDIGYDIDGRLDIHESLSKLRRSIFHSAMQLKREKKLASVFTVRGNVFVKVKTNSKAVHVKSSDALQLIAASLTPL